MNIFRVVIVLFVVVFFAVVCRRNGVTVVAKGCGDDSSGMDPVSQRKALIVS